MTIIYNMQNVKQAIIIHGMKIVKFLKKEYLVLQKQTVIMNKSISLNRVKELSIEVTYEKIRETIDLIIDSDKDKNN